MLQLRFLGAAGTVTGSSYSLRVGERKILIDCGLFQGHKELRERNWAPFPEEPSSFDAMLLTHAHIDHSGAIPRLVKEGFRGKIFTTTPTAKLCELLLPDSARLQEEEADYRNRKGITKHQPALPLYTEQEAYDCLRQFRSVHYRKPFEVIPGVRVTFHDAGHILGSAWLLIESQGKRLLMSGDLGRKDAPIVCDPEPPVPCDWMVLESTYGDRTHTDEPVGPRLAAVIKETAQRKGVVVIPAFAVERTQDIVWLLQELRSSRDIGRIPVFVDSPMAAKAIGIFEHSREFFDEEAADHALLRGKLFDYPKLKICQTTGESKAVARAQPPFIVVSASGMATGGRVLHHLRNYLPDARNTVLLVGFQSAGTRGWRLKMGEPTLRIFGEDIPVMAQVVSLDGFSGHADYVQINEWLGTLKTPPARVFLVHGEAASLEAQRQRIGAHAYVPAHLETVELA